MIRYFFQLFCRLLFDDSAGLTVHCLVCILSFLSLLSFNGTCRENFACSILLLRMFTIYN